MKICNRHCQGGHGHTVTNKRAKVVEETPDSNLPHRSSAILFTIFGRVESGTRESGIGKPLAFHHRRPKLCGKSLDFGFRRECMKINKMRPKFHVLAKS